MKIFLDHSMINESAYEGQNSGIFIFSYQDMISQVEQEILHGTPTCYLLSGYRGAGKTSLIKKVEEDLRSESNILFIYLSFAKYEKFSLILRKIIREVYLGFSETEHFKRAKNESPEHVKSIQLLFERTFNEVTQNSKISNNKETNLLFNQEINLKKLIILLTSLILGGLNLRYEFLNWVLRNYDSLIFFILAGWTSLEVLKLQSNYSLKKVKLQEVDRKSLYDDEIAETQLKKLLKDIKDLDVKLVFILDELDKIENEDEIDSLVRELKPIMLSGLASFILVSGQKLFYKYKSSQIHDDSIMSSIFSKQIHVPLLPLTSFHELFERIISDKSLISNEIVKDYVDSLVLNCNRLPRRFINLIRQSIVWENGRAYLNIDEEDLKTYGTDAKILSVIYKILDNEISSGDYDQGITDFFIMQLHLWVQKMKLKGSLLFTKDDIYNVDIDYSEIYPYWYVSQLNDLCILLLEKLVEQGLLDKNTEEQDQNVIVYYKWTELASLAKENIKEDSAKIKSKFIENIIDLESYLRDIYIDLVEGYTYDSPKISIRKMLHTLVEMNIVSERWEANKELQQIFDLRNRMVHGEHLEINDLDLAQDFRFKINRFKFELIENYSFFVTQRYLEKNNFNVIKKRMDSNRPGYYDFIAINNDLIKPDILFDVKQSSFINHEIIYRSVEMLKEYNRSNNKNNYLVIYIYDKGTRKNFERLLNRFKDVVQKQHPQLQGYIQLFHCSEYRSDASTGRLETYLNQILNKIANEINDRSHIT